MTWREISTRPFLLLLLVLLADEQLFPEHLVLAAHDGELALRRGLAGHGLRVLSEVQDLRLQAAGPGGGDAHHG